jgi:hypothetical protein
MTDSVAILAHGSECYSCGGTGNRLKRTKVDGKWRKLESECKACCGRGFIQRSKRRTSDGIFVRKAMPKSYPSFVAPGEMPVGSRGNATLAVREDEDLSYLVGNWRIFQHIARHRYSTDDLVTSWIACREIKQLGFTNPAVLDLGCGIGSVLLSNAWQLSGAVCVGIEAQPERYSQALRSIEYNVGRYPDEQQRIRVINADMRTAQGESLGEFPEGYDLITGTPPYFLSEQGVLPTCLESAGCLFELRGGVEAYCAAGRRFMRLPQARRDPASPALFVLCNTSLASSRVYVACRENNLSIIKRTDVIPRTGKPPLFTVFVITADEWIREKPELFPMLSPDLPPLPTDIDRARRVYESLRGELCDVICVRDLSSGHSPEYQAILRDLGKPSSADRETYQVPPRAATTDQGGPST